MTDQPERPLTGVKGIIFDLDNTILRSRIDFPRMKAEVFRCLAESGAVRENFPVHEHTTATLIEHARRSGVLQAERERAIWEIVSRFEEEGMRGAALEPDAARVLGLLRPSCRLVILTNNSYAAARLALQANRIDGYFEQIVGREQAVELKPSPAGVRYILGMYPQLPASRWLSVGDAWIDGKAAQDAGVRFLAYRGNRREMERRQVYPIGYAEHWEDVLNSIERD